MGIYYDGVCHRIGFEVMGIIATSSMNRFLRDIEKIIDEVEKRR